MIKAMKINIPTALMFLDFHEASTGRDDNTRPGVGFGADWYPQIQDEYLHPPFVSGVIPRDEAKRLHAWLGKFLEAHPPV